MAFYTEADLQAIGLTLKLATLVTVLLILISTPIAWWLARTQSPWKNIVSAIVTLPLVLPPTVLGFYLLIAMAPQGWLGQLSQQFGVETLAFTFPGLVIGSLIYSLPFAVQPIHNAFEALGQRPLEVAATLRASPWDTFLHVVIPLSKPGFISAAVLSFAHTLGEFGVVLMIGGNIPGETRVISVQIYDHVETLDYSQAHTLALTMVIFSLVVLAVLYSFNKKQRQLI